MPRIAIIGCSTFFLLIVAALIAIGLTISRRPAPVYPSPQNSSIRGAFHVHSDGSHDGKLTIDQLAIAARQAGLSFVILTDHTSAIQPPIIQRGVLFLKFSEWSTTSGHVIQLKGEELQRSEKQSLDVLRTIETKKGLSIIAHPFDLKRPWIGQWEGFTGLEIINTASSLRHFISKNLFNIIPFAAGYFINQDLAWLQLYRPNRRALQRWQSEAQSNPIGLCGVDLHGWIDPQKNLNLWNLILPGSFPEDIGDQETYVIEHLKRGEFYCSSAQSGHPIEMHIEFKDGKGVLLKYEPENPPTDLESLSVKLGHSNASDLRIVLYRNNQRLMSQPGPELVYRRPGPGIYRIEIEADLPTLLKGYYKGTLVYSNLFKIFSTSLETEDKRSP